MPQRDPRLGESLGLSFQQIQKYERGVDRITVGRLVHLAQVLDVPIPYFLNGLSGPVESSAAKVSKSLLKSADGGTTTNDPMSKRETLELVRAYYQIEKPELRKRVVALIRSIAFRRT